MKIEVLGPGCPRCQTLEANVREAIRQLDIEADVEKVTAMGEIAARGVMSVPGVVVDGEVVSTGKLLSVEEVKTILGK
jgi:small redox-active disulfide protein 2